MKTPPRRPSFRGLVFAPFALGLGLLAVRTASAQTVPLYVGSSPGGPASQGWLASAVIGPGQETAVGGGVQLNSLVSNSIYAGYSNRQANIVTTPSLDIVPGALVNPLFPALDRQQGFTLDFTVRVISQVNNGTNGPDRAGFSVTLLGQDARGIELGFQSTRIFAQSASPLFTAAESSADLGQNPSALDVAGVLTSLASYSLTIIDNTYSLTTGGSVLLTGTVRDYSAATGLGAGAYDATNFIFLGDNTTSARANIELTAVSITVIPEPACFAGGAGLLALCTATLRRRAKAVRPSN